MLLFSDCTPSTVLNWASWAMNSPFCCGDIGSWFFNWATSSLRNSSLPRLLLPLTLCPVSVAPLPAARLLPLTLPVLLLVPLTLSMLMLYSAH